MAENLANIFSNPLFGIVTSIAAYCIGVWINKKLKSPLVHPLTIAMILILLMIQFTPITFEQYSVGGDVIAMLLPPATAALALSIFYRWQTLKKNWLPVLAGCFVGSLTSMGSVFLLCKLFGLDSSILFSLLPKSVTTPIAMEIASGRGGIVSVAVAAVVITGIIGAVLCPVLIKVMHIQDPVAQGIAIGTCSHGLGTTRAVEIGEVQGAMSGLAIGIAGLATVVLSLFF